MIAPRTSRLRTESATHRRSIAVTLCGQRVTATRGHTRSTAWPVTKSGPLFRESPSISLRNHITNTHTANRRVGPAMPNSAHRETAAVADASPCDAHLGRLSGAFGEVGRSPARGPSHPPKTADSVGVRLSLVVAGKSSTCVNGSFTASGSQTPGFGVLWHSGPPLCPMGQPRAAGPHPLAQPGAAGPHLLAGLGAMEH